MAFTFLERIKHDITREQTDHEFLLPVFWPIILSYVHMYQDQMITFCNDLGWGKYIEPLKAYQAKTTKDCAQQMQNLLIKANETANIVSAAEQKIEIQTDSIKKTQARLLEQKLANQREAANQKIQTFANPIQGNIASLQMQIEAYKEDVNQALASEREQTEEHARTTLQLALEKEYRTGAIATERATQALAKRELQTVQENLANSTSFFHEICHMVRSLEEFQRSMVQEIARKRPWNNRIRVISTKDLDVLALHKIFFGRFWKYGLVATTCCIVSVLGLAIALAPLAPPLVLPMAILTLFALSIIWIITVLTAFAEHIYYDEAVITRFDNYTLSQCFSHYLLSRFDTIKEKIHQGISEAVDIEQPKADHPLLGLDKKTAKVRIISDALDNELIFFKKLQSQSPVYQAQLLGTEEKASPGMEMGS